MKTSKIYYKDYCGTYSITTHRDGTATLRCRDYYGNLRVNKTYKNENGAKISLGKYCGGMPTRVN